MKIMQKEYSWAQGVESVNTLFCSKICKRALIKSSVNETPQREATDIKKLYLNRQSIEGEPFFFFLSLNPFKVIDSTGPSKVCHDGGEPGGEEMRRMMNLPCRTFRTRKKWGRGLR